MRSSDLAASVPGYAASAMASGKLPTYALLTPARDEERNLPRLAAAVLRQSVVPLRWVIVDQGSTDATSSIGGGLAAEHDWIRLVPAPDPGATERGGPIVRAFLVGLAHLDVEPDVVVKLDADVSFERDHFERLLAEFAADPALGIASGTCWEEGGGEWRPQHVTRSHVRGAVRAYRRRCLEDVSPLEERIGWDGIDEIKATVRGWRTTSLGGIRFYHHRPLGERERSRVSMWVAQGDMGHYMGYRPSYLVARTLFSAVRDPAALAMIWGYASATAGRRPRCPDAAARAWLRREQRLRALPVRALEALGRREPDHS